MAPIRYPKYTHDETPVYITGVVDWKLSVRPHTWRPPTDIYETDTRYVVRVEIAGMKEAEFSVTVDNHTITIRGVRSDKAERRAYHQMEIHYGEFSIEIEFPESIDINGVEAGYDERDQKNYPGERSRSRRS
jgi:HSP20 family molecular chaperone IbpA